MKDEVLQKVLDADTSIIPRYDILLPDGTKVAENVQLVLKNTVLTAGTPLNKQSLLKDATATLYGLNATNALPDDVLSAIRKSLSYCPKLKINSLPNTTIYVKNANTGVQTTYTVPSTGQVLVDILTYGTYKVRGVLNNASTDEVAIDVDETKVYTMNIGNFITYVKITVEAEIGATVRARHTDGTTINGIVGATKTCTLALLKTGTWTITGEYNYAQSLSTLIQVTEAMANATTDKALWWARARIEVDSGSTVILTKDSSTLYGTSVNGVCEVWLTSLGTWNVKASLGSYEATGTVYASEYSQYIITIRYV